MAGYLTKSVKMNEFFEEFQEFRKILCICPHCAELVRLSDLRLTVKGIKIKTWLDEYERKIYDVDKKEERFEEIKEKLREQARERGRLGAEKIIKNAMCMPFKSLGLDPHDFKPILNPVDFVVFKGMNSGKEINDIIFLSKQCNNSDLCSIRRQIEKVIADKKYELQIARIDEKPSITFE
jgi:predicted Holliday junction resolvase-like endonuclease